ncbi:MAG: sigma-70 family RNA polymerase sigma factor [Acidobacteriia bacterium]|nr:sigma-70 family RNA polymerase sigma factor [Terriglobia bacterium]
MADFRREATGASPAEPQSWLRSEAAVKQAAWAAYIERCARGDQAALGALYDETSRVIYGIALRMLGEPADAEEVTLDVYSQAWRSAGSYSDRRGSVATWLVMLARSRAIDRLRSKACRARIEEPIPKSADYASPIPGPEEEIEWNRQRRRVQAAIDSLPAEQKQALDLAVFSGLTHTELAAALNQPLGTVKSRVRLGMMKIREVLGESA